MGKYLALLKKIDTVASVESQPKFALRVVESPADPAAALALLERLKAYVLPSGRMPAIHALAERMCGLSEPAAILSALQAFEQELIAMGGQHDPALTEAALAVAAVFPFAKLVEIGKRVLS